MKKKCETCGGKGGYYVKHGWFDRFVSCFQCKGKGSWYTSKRPQKPKGPR